MVLILDELFCTLNRLHTLEVSAMDLMTLKDDLYEEMATVKHFVCCMKMHGFSCTIHPKHLTLEELCDALNRLHQQKLSVSDLFNLQETLSTEIGIVHYLLKNQCILKRKYCDNKPEEAGD